MTLANTIAAKAETIVNTLTATHYQHHDAFDPSAGVYDCDCNGFAMFVLQAVAPENFSLIAAAAGEARPLAYQYFDFFAALPPSATSEWTRIDGLAQAGRGDVMSWRLATLEPGENTGHVVILAETPNLDASGDFYTVRVYDSADEPHFDDTRPSPKGKTGVGSGIINLKVDAEGRPVAYLFAPPLTAQYAYRPIAIGRAL